MHEQVDGGPEIPEAQVKAAVEVCKHLRKTLHAHHMYSPGHQVLNDFTESLSSTLGQYLAQFGTLELVMGSMNPALSGQPLLQDEKRDQSITHRLFLQGVQTIRFSEGVPRTELESLCALWAEMLRAQEDADHNFATRIWELDLAHIEAQAVAPYADNPYLSAEDRARNEARVTDAQRAIVEPSEGFEAVPRDERRRWGRKDLEAAVDAVDGIAQGQIDLIDARLASAEVLGAGLRASTWASRVAADRPTIPSRAVAALFGVVPLADPDEAEQISAQMARILRAFVDLGRLPEAAQVVRKAHQLAESAIGSNDARARAWDALLDALESPEVIDPTLVSLVDPALVDSAFSLLFFARPGVVQKLCLALPTVSDPDTRHLLAELIRDRDAPSKPLADIARTCDHGLFFEILFICDALPRNRVLRVLASAIENPDPTIRKAAVRAIPKAAMADLHASLRPLIVDDDPEVRKIVRDVLVKARDVGAVEPLGRLFDRITDFPDEQRTVVVALGQIGGSDAGRVLRGILDGNYEADHRATAALALANVGDRPSIEALETQSRKLLVRKRVKDACKESLERIRGRGDLPAPPPPPAAIPSFILNHQDEDTYSLSPLSPAPRAGAAPSSHHDDEDVEDEFTADDFLDAPTDAEADPAPTEEAERAWARPRSQAPQSANEIRGKQLGEPAEAKPERSPGERRMKRRPEDHKRKDRPTPGSKKGADAPQRGAVARDEPTPRKAAPAPVEEPPPTEETEHIEEDAEARARRQDEIRRRNEELRARLKRKGGAGRNAPVEVKHQRAHKYRADRTPDVILKEGEAPPPELAGRQQKRPKGMPDFETMFKNYVVLQVEGAFVFGRRYGAQLLDVHRYEVPSAIIAYHAFFRDKAKEGFIPLTSKGIPFDPDNVLEAVDHKKIESAYRDAVGAP